MRRRLWEEPSRDRSSAMAQPSAHRGKSTFAPFVLRYGWLTGAGGWGDIAMGCVIDSVALARLVRRVHVCWLEGVDVVCAMLLVAAIPALAAAPMSEQYNDIAIGLTVMALGLWSWLVVAAPSSATRCRRLGIPTRDLYKTPPR